MWWAGDSSVRSRSEDIPLLAEQFLRDMGRIYDEPPHKISPAAMERLTEYDSPGNVRDCGMFSSGRVH